MIMRQSAAGRGPSGTRGCLPGSVDEQGLSHECGSSFFEIIFILLKASNDGGQSSKLNSVLVDCSGGMADSRVY